MILTLSHPRPRGVFRDRGKRVDRRQILKRLDQAWGTLQASYAGLSASELLQPGVTGDWSVRDILAHVTTWEEEALRFLPLIVAGGTPPRYSVTYGGIDAFNARRTAAKSELSLSAVLRLMDDTHRRVVALIQAAPEDQLTGDTRFRRRLRLDTYGHYLKHADAIRQWRAQRSAGQPSVPRSSSPHTNAALA
jgi:DinB superfamily